jgi:Flp pilus assembly protein TadG
MEIELLFKRGGRAKLMEKCLQKETFARVRKTMRQRLASDTRGQELVEFAFILPILLMLFMGIVYLGRAISVYQALGKAARDGARAALETSCATCGNTPNTAAATAAIDGALQAASLDPTMALVSGPNPLTPLNPSDPVNYQVNGVTVQVQYPVQLNIPFTTLNGTIFYVGQTVTMRQEF